MNKNKLTVLSFLIFGSCVTFSSGRNIIEVKVGGNFNTTYKSIEKNGNEILGKEAKGGYEITLEGLKEVFSNTYMGIGIGLQKHGEANNIGGEADYLYNSVPIYGTVKYQFNSDGLVQPFFKANLGLSFNRTEKGLRSIDESVNPVGFYGGLGGGIEVENFILDLTYQVNTAKTDKNFEEEINTSRLTLGLGYRFDF